MIIVTEMPPSRASVVAAFFDFGFLNAGTPLLMASTPVRAAQPDANARRIEEEARRCPVRPSLKPAPGSSCRLRALGHGQVAGERTGWRRRRATAPIANMNRYTGIGEQAPGLLDAAQVGDGQQDDEPDGERRLVPAQRREGRRRVLGARRDRHGHGEHVVDQQRAGHGDAGVGAEVRRRDLVVAAARRVGVHVLPVRRDDDEHHEDDGEPDPRRDHQGGRPGEREGQQDLVGRVRDRRERVRREHGQRDALGDEGVAEPVAADGTSEQQAFGGIREVRHDGSC